MTDSAVDPIAEPPPPAPDLPPGDAANDDSRPLLETAMKRHADLAELLAKGSAALTDPEFIHDVRVASRRLGEVARLFTRTGDLLDKPAAKAVESSLRALRRSMGDLRDADVTVEHLDKWRMPAPLKKLAHTLATDHKSRRASLEAAAADQLASASLAGAMVILARALEQPPGNAAEVEAHLQDCLRTLIKKRNKQLRAAFGKAARKQSPAALHDARIAVKKLRYLWELAQSFTRGAGKKVRTLKQFQELLGDHHDAHVIEAQLAAHAATPEAKTHRGLPAAWRKWRRDLERAQARRAADFLVKSYTWLNA